MNIDVNTSNRIYFQSNMNVRVQQNRNRWENISRIVEENTENMNDVIFLEERRGTKNEPMLYIEADTSITDKNFDEHCADISIENADKLLKKSDNEIANVIIKLIKLFRKQDEQNKIAREFIDKFIPKEKRDKDDFIEKFWDLVTKKLDDDIKKSKNQDPELRMFEVY